ncbi:MAG TPA: Gfo/Idh/MocA family oxidoreductase [Allosphingosinicella sp.]
MTIRTALIGRGMAGTVFHAPLLRALPDFDLAAIAGSADAAAAIAHPSTDLIVIATPNTSHAPLARAALEAGKHVVVDKPFALSSAEADALIALARERGRLLTVFHNRRWDGDFLTARALLGSGRLGAVKLCEMHWDRFRPAIKPGWREGGGEGSGLLFDLGPHLIDQALLLFGMPDALDSDVAVQRAEAQADDYFALTLHYPDLRVRLHASNIIAAPRPRFALYGTGGAISKRGVDPQEAALREGVSPLAPGFGEDPTPFQATFPAGYEEIPILPGRYLAFYEGVVDAILRGAPAPVDPADARDGLRLIETARESARTGRRISLAAATRPVAPAPAG